jgi:peptidyl-prolyl cis-trans isomerase SurA
MNKQPFIRGTAPLRWLLLLAGLAWMAPLWAQSSGGSAQTADYIVAVVNSEPITNKEVQTRMQRMVAQMSQQGQSLPPRDELAPLVLERLIVERVQLQTARSTGIRVDDAALEQAVQDVARQNQIDLSELNRRLASDGLTMARLREDLRDELLMARLREREVDGRIKVSEQDIDRFLADRRTAPTGGPVELNIAQVLVAVPDNPNPEQLGSLEAKARQVRRLADAGEDFAELARQWSDAPDRAGGGQLGLRSPDRHPPLFVQAVEKLPVGGITGPLRSGAGFHVLKLLERQQADGLPTSVTQTRARHILLKSSPRLSEAQARQRLNEFKRRIEAGQAEFGQLAREFSEDGSAAEGGELGWATPGMFVPEFEQVMDELKPGELSQPLVSRFGMHLIQVLERRSVPLSERERRDLARRELRAQKTEDSLRDFLQELRGRAYVEMRQPPQ